MVINQRIILSKHDVIYDRNAFDPQARIFVSALLAKLYFDINLFYILT